MNCCKKDGDTLLFIYTQSYIHRQGLKNGLRNGWQSIPSEP